MSFKHTKPVICPPPPQPFHQQLMDQPPRRNQLSSDLITLRNLQNQIQSGNHPIYNSQSSHSEHFNLPASSSHPPAQSNAHPSSQPPRHAVSYHQPSSLHPPVHQPLGHYQDLNHYATKPNTPHPSIPSNGSPNYYHHPIPQTHSESTPRYSPPNPKLADPSLPIDPRQNSNLLKPYPTHRPSSDTIKSKTHEIISHQANEPTIPRDPRLIHNRVSSQSHQTTPIDPSHSQPRSTHQDDTNRDRKGFQSDHSHPKWNDQKDRQSREPHFDHTKHHPQQKSPQKYNYNPSKASCTEDGTESTGGSEHDEKDGMVGEEEIVDLSALEADQKRYQEELARYHEELEIYQRKRKEREEAEKAASEAVSKQTIPSKREKRANERRRDSTDEYLKRSLETVGDPSHRNRRFSVAGDRSTLLPSSIQNKSPVAGDPTSSSTEPLNVIAEIPANKTSLHPEKETVEAATVLLGLGLARSAISVNTTTTTTTTTSSTSTVVTQTQDPASGQLCDESSVDQLNGPSAPTKLESKKKPSIITSSKKSRKKTSSSSVLTKNQKPLTCTTKSNKQLVGPLENERVTHFLDQSDDQIIIINKKNAKNNNKSSKIESSSSTHQVVPPSIHSKKKQKLMKLNRSDENKSNIQQQQQQQQQEKEIKNQAKTKTKTMDIYNKSQQDGTFRLVCDLLDGNNQKNGQPNIGGGGNDHGNDEDEEEEDQLEEDQLDEDQEHQVDGGLNQNEQVEQEEEDDDEEEEDEEQEDEEEEGNHIICHVLRNRKIIKYAQ